MYFSTPELPAHPSSHVLVNFFHGSDQVPNRNNLKSEGFILDHGPSWWRGVVQQRSSHHGIQEAADPQFMGCCCPHSGQVFLHLVNSS
jgi:hypothetical protein